MNRVLACIVLVLIAVFAIGFAMGRVTKIPEKIYGDAVVASCENLVVAVKITEVSSTTPQLTIGKGTVLEPQSEAGKEIPVSIPKKFAVGQTIRQCVNIIVE